jgi:RNA polymerase sigma factor (sigma-70 family)
MSQSPETRESLILRVQDPADEEAWREFVGIYRPVVYRLARRRGLQDADAEDLAQRVLMSVARAIGGWEPDRERGPFRGWLRRIARNAIINAVTRGRPDAGAGGTSMLQRLEQRPGGSAAGGGALEELETEYRRSVLRWAAREVQREFHEETWAAFRMTAVEGRSVEEVSAALDKLPGAVYAARSRVMRRLRSKVAEYERAERDL